MNGTKNRDHLPMVSLVAVTSIMLISLIIQNIEQFLVMTALFGVNFLVYQYGVGPVLEFAAAAPQKTRHLVSNRIKILKKESVKFPSLNSQITGKITASPISPDAIIRIATPILRSSPMVPVQRLLSSKLREAIAESGQANNSRLLGMHSIAYAMFSAVLFVPAGVITGIFLHVLFFVICGIPGIILVYGLIHLKSLKMARKSAMEHELPIAVACASILESINVTFFDFLIKLSKKDTTLFPVLKKDARMFNRNIKFFGMSPNSALKKLAENHPHKEFQNFVWDYISAYATSGINTANVMESKTNKLFRSLKFHIESYTSNANGMSQMVLLTMIALPLLSIGSTFIATGDTAATLTVSILFMLPVITMMLIAYTDSNQPKTQDDVSLSAHAAIAALASAAVTVMLGLRLWEVLGIAAVLFAATNTIQNWKKFRDIADTDDSLESFLQNVTDNKESGIDIFASIKKIAAADSSSAAATATATVASHKKVFADSILEISKKMTFGKSISDACQSVDLKSWLSRVVFFILAEMHESGGANTRILRVTTSFVGQYTTARKEMVMSLKGSLVIAYIVPLLMVIMLVISIQMTEKITSDMSDLETLPIDFSINTVTDSFLDWSYMLVIECSVLVALIMSKITYFTVKHTLHVAILTGMALVLCHAVPRIPSFL